MTAVRKAQTIMDRNNEAIDSLVFLVLVGYVGCNRAATMVCMTLTVSFIGFHASGCEISHPDVASDHADSSFPSSLMKQLFSLSLL